MNGSTPEQAVLKVSNIRGFLATLQAIKPSNPKQVIELCHLGEKWDQSRLLDRLCVHGVFTFTLIPEAMLLGSTGMYSHTFFGRNVGKVGG
jgi:hypothetical protein